MKEESSLVYKVIDRKVRPEFRDKYLGIMRELRLSTELGDLIQSVTLLEHKAVTVVEIYEYSEKITTIEQAHTANLNKGESIVFRDRLRKIIPRQKIESRFFLRNGRVCKIIERQIHPEHLSAYQDIMRELRISSTLGDLITDVQIAYGEVAVFTEVYEYSSKYQDIAEASRANEANKISPVFQRRFKDLLGDEAASSRFMTSVKD